MLRVRLITMSFTPAVFALHVFYQKLPTTPLPYKIDASNNRFTSNEGYSFRKNLWLRRIVRILIYGLLLKCFMHLHWLFFHWKYYTRLHFEEAVIYTVIVCALGIYVSFSYTQEIHGKTFVYIYNQIALLQVAKTQEKKIGSIIKPLFVMGMAACSLIGLMGFALGPFTIDFCPIQLVFGNSLIARLFASLLYGSLYYYCIPAVLSLGTLNLVLVEWMIKYSCQICKEKIEVTRKASNTMLRKPHSMFQMFRLITSLYSFMCDLMYTVLVFIGIFMISCAGYCTVEMAKQLPFLVYIALSTLFVLGILIAIVFTDLTGIPCSNVDNLRTTWKRLQLARHERMILNSMPMVGFKLGPYGLVTKTLGIRVCDDIINNLVSLLLT